MSVLEILRERKSTRAFIDKAVSPELISTILDAARYAPSGANTQPWKVAVVSGKAKLELQQLLEKAFSDGVKPAMDYQYYPIDWESPYQERRNACGMQLYQALNIQREDKQRRKSQWAANYRAFDAPVMMLFFLDNGLQAGSFMDTGMFLQSIMLAAQELGLATCPQAALAEFPGIVKSYLGYPQDSIMLCGMALGYEDSGHAVNSYRTPREEISSFTRFYD